MPSARRRLDLSGAVMALFAAILALLIILPLAWLVVFAFSDRRGTSTLANFQLLFTDKASSTRCSLRSPSPSLSVICCAVAAPMGWLVARTDMPGAASDPVLVTASFVTPPFLGAIAWELLAAPNSGLLNQLYRSM